MNKLLLLTTVTASLAIAGCGGGSTATEPVEIERQPSSSVRSASGIGCDTLGSLPGSDLLSISNSRETPRANPSAETLAIEASRETTAPAALYERVVAELSGLTSRYPERASTAAFPCYELSTLLVEVNDQQDDRYDSYNDTLQLTSSRQISRDGLLELSFNGLYNMRRVAEQYSHLDNVESAITNNFAGDNNDVCLEIRDSDHLYIFDIGAEDCPSGCLGHEYHGFTVDADGNMTDLGSYISSSAQQPEWFNDAMVCRDFL